MKPSRALAISLSLVAIVSCTQSSKSPELRFNTTIGPEGGTLVVGNGQLALTVPPGALDRNVNFSVVRDEASDVQGWIDAGIAYAFEPRGTVFALPAQITVPYDFARVSVAVESGELAVGFRNEQQTVAALAPTQVEYNFATCETSSLGTFWVAAPNIVSAAALFPLRKGDTYTYESGLVLTVDKSKVEPNLAPTEVVKAVFTAPGRVSDTFRDGSGFYLDNGDGLAQLGSFDGDTGQEIFAAPVRLLAERDPVGTTRRVVVAQTGYVPYGSRSSAYQRPSETKVEILERVRIVTPLRPFETVRVRITTRALPPTGESLIELWLVEGVGPVAVRLGASAEPRLLVAARVNGRPVIGY